MFIIVCVVLGALITGAATIAYALLRARDGYESESGFHFGALPRRASEKAFAFDPVGQRSTAPVAAPRFRARPLKEPQVMSPSKAAIALLEAPDPVTIAHATFVTKS